MQVSLVRGMRLRVVEIRVLFIGPCCLAPKLGVDLWQPQERRRRLGATDFCSFPFCRLSWLGLGDSADSRHFAALPIQHHLAESSGRHSTEWESRITALTDYGLLLDPLKGEYYLRYCNVACNRQSLFRL